MTIRALAIATLVGMILQLTMVFGGHRVPALQDWYGPGGMFFSLFAGLLHARMAGRRWRDVLVGGALAGGICALLGIGASYWLGDVPASLLILGTAGSAVAGAAGGALGRKA